MGYPVNTLVGARGGTAPMSQFPQTPSPASGSESSIGATIGMVDGTPMRVATIALLMVGGLAALKYARFKFNVTVG